MRQKERDGSQPSLPIILFASQAEIMIILFSKKSNTNFKEKMQKIQIQFKERIQIYLNTVNFGHLECPHCHSHDLIRWGSYERNVIFFSYVGNSLESKILKIHRVRCKSCGKTHALLPFGIIPYKQFTDEVISKILEELTNDTLENISIKYQIDPLLIKKWCYQYNKFHRSKVNTLTNYHNSKMALIRFLNNFANKLNYINHYNLSFMQIKLGCLGLCSS